MHKAGPIALFLACNTTKAQFQTFPLHIGSPSQTKAFFHRSTENKWETNACAVKNQGHSTLQIPTWEDEPTRTLIVNA